MTEPKLTRIPWPKSKFATTGEWLNSLLPKPPPPTKAEVEQRKAEADRRQRPPRGGADMTSLFLTNMYHQGLANDNHQ